MATDDKETIAVQEKQIVSLKSELDVVKQKYC